MTLLVAEHDSALTASDSHSGSTSKVVVGSSGGTSERPDLTIVIPALNEQESIASTIQRCLDARQSIRDVGGIGRIEIIVVSDGSTDKTVEIAMETASREADVQVIVFESNRGYGAAIKAGFERGTGDLVAFLDADGTCDPRYFGPLCLAVDRQDAAIVLGSRMSRDSKMPRVRRIGNWLYALLLGLLSGKAVEDTASGMRVLRRVCLSTLYPLPNGLNFTPAMSARALFTDLKIVEIPMSYSERVGRSKLSVLRDGVRFLVSILDALLLFRPGRFFVGAAFACLTIAAVWGLYPAEFYLKYARLEEWMIYRILFCAFSIACAGNLLVAGAICDRILGLVFPESRAMRTFSAQLLERLTSPPLLLGAAAAALLGAFVFVSGGLWEYVTTGHVTTHWSRVIVASLLMQLSLVAVIGCAQQKVVMLWRKELTSSKGTRQ